MVDLMEVGVVHMMVLRGAAMAMAVAMAVAVVVDKEEEVVDKEEEVVAHTNQTVCERSVNLPW